MSCKPYSGREDEQGWGIEVRVYVSKRAKEKMSEIKTARVRGRVNEKKSEKKRRFN